MDEWHDRSREKPPNSSAVKDVVDCHIAQPDQEFGIDYDGPFPEDQCHTVDVPDTVCPIPDDTDELFVHGDSVNIDDAVMEYTTKRSWLISYLSSVTS